MIQHNWMHQSNTSASSMRQYIVFNNIQQVKPHPAPHGQHSRPHLSFFAAMMLYYLAYADTKPFCCRSITCSTPLLRGIFAAVILTCFDRQLSHSPGRCTSLQYTWSRSYTAPTAKTWAGHLVCQAGFTFLAARTLGTPLCVPITVQSNAESCHSAM